MQYGDQDSNAIFSIMDMLETFRFQKKQTSKLYFKVNLMASETQNQDSYEEDASDLSK